MIYRTNAVKMPTWAGTPTFEEVHGWRLALEYDLEDKWDVGLVDLSHRPKAVVHEDFEKEFGLYPQDVLFKDNAFYCVRKPDEGVWFGLSGDLAKLPDGKNITDVTDGLVFLALMGEKSLDVMRRMAAIDLELPQKNRAFYAYTRSHGLGLEIINPKFVSSGFFLACERSHGQNLVNSLFNYGANYGIGPVGLNKYKLWLKKNISK